MEDEESGSHRDTQKAFRDFRLRSSQRISLIGGEPQREREEEEEDDEGKTENRSAETKCGEESEVKGVSARGQSCCPQSQLPNLFN
ncbi:uncharacterized protein LOC132176668 isoform X2 [Corylus avellana]|uniref:uncharacterized protein LOC132176668 isoform X2 n=1 Tax=Corylus avellana TaxID=13451 RepID=UPI00286D41FD|nr:uncharacterized protein LOC132176668 isoform X2 [Corylus avellana]